MAKQRKCFRCGVADPVLKQTRHADGQMHLTCVDCAGQLADLRKVVEMRKVTHTAGCSITVRKLA